MRFAVVCFVIALGGLGIWSLPTWYQSKDSHCYLQDGRLFDDKQVEFLMETFSKKGISDAVVKDGKISIATKHRLQCNKILASPDFAKVSSSPNDTRSEFFQPFMSSAEKEKIARQQKLKQLEDLITRLDGIRDVKIIYSQARSKGFSRADLQSAAITLWANEDTVINPRQAATVRQILCKSFAGMQEQDVLIVDGDTGSTFEFSEDPTSHTSMVDAQQVIESQRDLELTRKQIEIQSQKLLEGFGKPKVVVRMDLEKRTIRIAPDPDKKPVSQSKQNSSVVANGSGAIKKQKTTQLNSDDRPKTQIVSIKRLLGIEVSVPRNAVVQYIREQLGVEQDVTEEQFSRGTVSVRNEIKKLLVRWLRSQQGIDVGSDLVTVLVVAENSKTETGLAMQDQSASNLPLVPTIATCGIVIAIGLLALTWKSRGPRRERALNEQVSGGGRDFVVRNQSNAGRELAEEANEVVHSAPANSARAFQNLVAGENH